MTQPDAPNVEPRELADVALMVFPSDKEAFLALCQDHHGIRATQGGMFRIILEAYLHAQKSKPAR